MIPCMPGQRRRQFGFSLLELVVAVAVFAIVAVVIYGRTGDVMNQEGRIETRTLATWVAENRLTVLQIQPRQPGDSQQGLPSGRSTEQHRLGGRDWRVETEFFDTSTPTFRRVQLRVYPADEKAGGAAAAVLTGFIGAER